MELRTTNHDYEWHPKYFAVIVGLFTALYMIALATVGKMVDFFGLTQAASIFVFPLCCILTDVMTEVYGFNRTRQAIWTVLACVLLYTIFTQLTVWATPASFFTEQKSFEAVFSTSVRVATAGCLAWLAGEFFNSYVMSKMKIFQNAKGMSVRFIGSTVVGQFFDSVVFFTVAFLGIMPTNQLVSIIVTTWGLKIAYEVLALPLSTTATRHMKRLEGIEHFDRQKISII